MKGNEQILIKRHDKAACLQGLMLINLLLKSDIMLLLHMGMIEELKIQSYLK